MFEISDENTWRSWRNLRRELLSSIKKVVSNQQIENKLKIIGVIMITLTHLMGPMHAIVFCYSCVMVQSTLAKNVAWMEHFRWTEPYHNHNVAISNELDIWRGLWLYHNKNNSGCGWFLYSLRCPEAKFKLNRTQNFIEILWCYIIWISEKSPIISVCAIIINGFCNIFEEITCCKKCI